MEEWLCSYLALRFLWICDSLLQDHFGKNNRLNLDLELLLIVCLLSEGNKMNLRLLCDNIHHCSEKLLHHLQTSFLSMKWKIYPGFQCKSVRNLEFWITCLLNYMQPNIKKELESLISFSFSSERQEAKIRTVFSRSVQILDSSLNIIFIQSSTQYIYFIFRQI